MMSLDTRVRKEEVDAALKSLLDTMRHGSPFISFYSESRVWLSFLVAFGVGLLIYMYVFIIFSPI